MSRLPNPTSDDVEQLLLNARLRDELEPYVDESVNLVSLQSMPISAENDFLQSMLDWERAPILPISKWFEPELVLPQPESIDASSLRQVLSDTLYKLYSKRIVLEFTEHLSDRQLYCLIYRDILPSFEKKVAQPRNYLHWHCLDESDVETWLTYYATDEEREMWQLEMGGPLPNKLDPPYPRRLPSRPDHM